MTHVRDAQRQWMLFCILLTFWLSVLARAFDHMALGTEAGIAEAERLYATVLPLLILLMESMDTFLVYGKPVLGHRLGIAEIKPRLPSTPPSAFGLATAKRYAEMLGKL